MSQRINPWLLFGLGAAAVMWFATRVKAADAAAIPKGSGAGLSLQPGSGAVTSGQVAQAGNFWNGLTPVEPLDSGYVNFPSGSQAAAALLATAMDPMTGQYYVQWAGRVFVLGSQDASGNWPAQPLPGTPPTS